MFLLQVEFKARKNNGDVEWLSRSIFWEETFNTLPSAMSAFMEMVPNPSMASDKFQPCNIRGWLIENHNSNDEKVVHSWDWENIELAWEFGRSKECEQWIKSIAQTQTIDIKKSTVVQGILLTDLLFKCKLCSSRSDARRQIEAGGIKVNNNKVADTKYLLLLEDFNDSKMLLGRGKKNKLIFKLVNDA